MMEWFLSSAVLIGVVLLLRALLRGKLSPRVQYALWAVVLVRLLVPVSLGSTAWSVGTLTRKAAASGPVLSVTALSERELPRLGGQVEDEHWGEDRREQGLSRAEMSGEDQEVRAETAIREREKTSWTVGQMLRALWLAGATGVGLWFLLAELHLARKLKRSRVPMGEHRGLPVYRSDAVDTPCLFGLFRPAIYLTGAALESPQTRHHALEHEWTHYHHGDHLWAALRGACLALHWFDPLVWYGAAVSRNDGELACDEATVERLGEEQRAAYGRTLIRLTCDRRPVLLTTATTMTGGGESLKKRIALLVERPKTAGHTLALVVAITALAVGCTFTGGEEEAEPVPLTGEELVWFNESFFNHSGYEDGSWQINYNNQCLSSTYARPEEIDLYELFYLGTGQEWPMTEAEQARVGNDDCPTTKLPVEAMDDYLTAHLGLTLEETEGVGLEKLDYLADYDAYYVTHGDTNYRSEVVISAGERAGEEIRLYYEDTFNADGWKCITLTEQGEGSFRFVSHLPCEEPEIRVVTIPAEEPWQSISLETMELTPVEPQAVETESVRDDCDQRGSGLRLEDGTGLRVYRSTDGGIYAAVVRAGGDGAESWAAERFFRYPAGTELDRCDLTSFRDLFGYSGAVVSYIDYITGGPDEGGLIGNIYDYYVFDGIGAPRRLLRAYEEHEAMDLDGDGEKELLTGRQLFFRRGGMIYEVDLKQALKTAWPELSFWDYSDVDAVSRCLEVAGMSSVPAWGTEMALAYGMCRLYFDGEALLVYKDLPETVEHLSAAVSTELPAEVLAAAKRRVELAYEATKAGEAGALSDQSFDDWRVSGLAEVPAPLEELGLSLEIYSLTYQFHAAEPGSVFLAGGAYIQEDGWYGGFYSEDSPYLVFLVREDGRVPLESYIPGMVGEQSDAFQAGVYRTLLKNGVCAPEELEGRALYKLFYQNQSVFLNELADFGASQSRAALEKLVTYAVEEVPQVDADCFWQGMENLRGNSSALTEGGRELYEELLELVEKNAG